MLTRAVQRRIAARRRAERRAGSGRDAICSGQSSAAGRALFARSTRSPGVSTATLSDGCLPRPRRRAATDAATRRGLDARRPTRHVDVATPADARTNACSRATTPAATTLVRDGLAQRLPSGRRRRPTVGRAMSACPACGNDGATDLAELSGVRHVVDGAPEPLAKVGAIGSGTHAGPSPEEQFFAPAVLQPIIQLPPAPPSRRAYAPRRAGRGPVSAATRASGSCCSGWCSSFVAAIATAWFTFGSSPAPRRRSTPVVLTPRPATAGLPSRPRHRWCGWRRSRRAAPRCRRRSRRATPTSAQLTHAQPELPVGRAATVRRPTPTPCRSAKRRGRDRRGRGLEPRRVRVRPLVDAGPRPCT